MILRCSEMTRDDSEALRDGRRACVLVVYFFSLQLGQL